MLASEHTTGVVSTTLGVVALAYVAFKIKRKRQHLRRIASILQQREVALVHSLEAMVESGDLVEANELMLV